MRIRSSFIALLLLAMSGPAFAADKPNIVFLLEDDFGGGDLDCYGHLHSRTPNIDSLAREGTRFMQFHATGATCCPTRTGLMTSKFPATYATYPANGGFANRVTITELQKKQGTAATMRARISRKRPIFRTNPSGGHCDVRQSTT